MDDRRARLQRKIKADLDDLVAQIELDRLKDQTCEHKNLEFVVKHYYERPAGCEVWYECQDCPSFIIKYFYENDEHAKLILGKRYKKVEVS